MGGMAEWRERAKRRRRAPAANRDRLAHGAVMTATTHPATMTNEQTNSTRPDFSRRMIRVVATLTMRVNEPIGASVSREPNFSATASTACERRKTPNPSHHRLSFQN